MSKIKIELEPFMAMEFTMYLEAVYAENENLIMSVENVLKQLKQQG